MENQVQNTSDSEKEKLQDLTTVQNQDTQSGPSSSSEGSKKRSNKKRVIVAAVILVVLIAAGFVAWFLVDQHSKEVWEQEHKEYPINITVTADGYDSKTSSPIPILIEGTDFEGKPVSVEALSGTSESESLSLMRGTYTLTVTASPFLSDGSMFDVGKSKVDFEVTGDGESGQGNASVGLAVLDEASMSEEQIASSKDKLVSLGFNEEKAAEFADTAEAKLKKYQDALAAQKAAEEALAKRHISTEWYEFDIPTSWVGKVEYSTTGDKTSVYLAGHPDYVLLTAYLDPEHAENEGDIGFSMIAHKNGSNFTAVIWANNWPSLAATQELGLADFVSGSSSEQQSIFSSLVSLSTGGNITYDQVVSDPDKYLNNVAAFDFAKQAIGSTLSIKK